MSIYTENGYKNRNEYLQELADENDVPFAEVYAIWSVIGDDEAFDGLVTAVEDHALQLEDE